MQSIFFLISFACGSTVWNRLQRGLCRSNGAVLPDEDVLDSAVQYRKRSRPVVPDHLLFSEPFYQNLSPELQAQVLRLRAERLKNIDTETSEERV